MSRNSLPVAGPPKGYAWGISATAEQQRRTLKRHLVDVATLRIWCGINGGGIPQDRGTGICSECRAHANREAHP